MSAGHDRRAFLAGGLGALGALAWRAPLVRARGLAARLLPEGFADGRSLVLIQLTGGNDGLSTLVPYADDLYHAARRTSRISAEEVLALDDRFGLHPRLERTRAHYDAGRVAWVQGAGYPEPSLSHFRSLDIWHAARAEGRRAGTGWIGRLCAAAWRDEARPELCAHVGGFAPFALHSLEFPPIALETPTSYRWMPEADPIGGDAEAFGPTTGAPAASAAERGEGAGRDAVLARLRSTQTDALESSARVRAAALAYRPCVAYPETRFGAALRDAAALLNGGLGTRVLSVALGGFDTHADQRQDHDALMAQLDEGLGALLDDLACSQAGRRAVVLAYSEFGRRFEENASRGHDHGKAGLMLVAGHGVRGGLYGAPPSLTELDDGDLAYTTDFRAVYGTIIERWFASDADEVLGARYEPLEFLPG